MLWNRNDLLLFRFKVFVPVPGPDPDFCPTTKKFIQILPFQCWKQHCFSESWHLIFLFVDFCIIFYVGPEYKFGSGTGIGMQYGSGSAKAKSCGSGSGSTTLIKNRVRYSYVTVVPVFLHSLKKHVCTGTGTKNQVPWCTLSLHQYRY
jgi:hypothetical protein